MIFDSCALYGKEAVSVCLFLRSGVGFAPFGLPGVEVTGINSFYIIRKIQGTIEVGNLYSVVKEVGWPVDSP